MTNVRQKDLLVLKSWFTQIKKCYPFMSHSFNMSGKRVKHVKVEFDDDGPTTG
jgi:hypothetical protein